MLFRGLLKLPSSLIRTRLSNSYSAMVRSKAPAFTAKAVIDNQVKQIRSEDLQGKYWILFFYPLDL